MTHYIYFNIENHFVQSRFIVHKISKNCLPTLYTQSNRWKKAVQIFAPHAASKQHYDNHCISHMLAWMMALGTQYAIKSWKEIAIWKSYNDCYKYFRKNTHFGLFLFVIALFLFLNRALCWYLVPLPIWWPSIVNIYMCQFIYFSYFTTIILTAWH